jgi:hypothetical protein
LDAVGALRHTIIRGIEKRRIVDDEHYRREFVSRLARQLGVSTSAISRALQEVF